MSWRECSPVSRTLRCACGACPRQRPDSYSARRWPTTFSRTPCSRTSDCAASASASNIRRSIRGFSKFSERFMCNEMFRPESPPALDLTFDNVVLPHLGAAYRLARWLVRDEHDAEDVVQEASLRAFRYFRTFTGGNGRAWFLRIVRNTCSGWRGHRFQNLADPFDEEQHSDSQPAHDPERLLLQTDDVTLIERALSTLPKRFRDVLVLRELEGLSYRELADGMGIPIGTVMSSLSRARRALRGAVDNELKQTGNPKTHRREPAADDGVE